MKNFRFNSSISRDRPEVFVSIGVMPLMSHAKPDFRDIKASTCDGRCFHAFSYVSFEDSECLFMPLQRQSPGVTSSAFLASIVALLTELCSRNSLKHFEKHICSDQSGPDSVTHITRGSTCIVGPTLHTSVDSVRQRHSMMPPINRPIPKGLTCRGEAWRILSASDRRPF